MINKEAAIAAIRTCKTREILEEELKRFEIVNAQDVISHLNEAMYSPQTFFSKEISLEDELEFTKQVFLTGGWRLNEYYEKFGLPERTA